MLIRQIIFSLLYVFLINSVSYATNSSYNEKLYTEIIEKLDFEPKLDASEITVVIRDQGNIVVLGGTVKNYIEKSIAEKAVKEIRGVKAVLDEITVNSSRWKQKKSDKDIATAAINIFQWNVLIPSERIQIVIDNGNVILSGEVDWQFQKNMAWGAVNNLLGVKYIVNNIVVKPSAKIDVSKVKENIAREFERHARLDADRIKVETKGKKIILKGEVRSFDEREEAEYIAWSIPGIEEVRNELVVNW